MRPPVHFEDPVVEILDAETEARDAHTTNGSELGVGERARLALERDLFGTGPGSLCGQTRHQPVELFRREERRRAATEVDEVERPSSDRRQRRVELPFARHDIQVAVDLVGILVGVDAKVAEVTPLPAERDVQVHPERDTFYRRQVQRRPRLRGDGRRGPHRKRRICGNEIAPDFRLVVESDGHAIGHYPITILQRALACFIQGKCNGGSRYSPAIHTLRRTSPDGLTQPERAVTLSRRQSRTSPAAAPCGATARARRPTRPDIRALPAGLSI